MSTAALRFHEAKAAILQVSLAFVLCGFLYMTNYIADALVPTLHVAIKTAFISTTTAVVLFAMYFLQRRVASGIPLAYPSIKAFAASDDKRNVRRNSRMVKHLMSPIRLRAYDRPVAVITGGNSGIGRVNALEFARLGFDVVICCRSEQRANEAILSINQKLNGCGGVVSFVPLDMEDEASIRAAVQTILDKYTSIAVIVNNAGMFSPVLNQRTASGDEKLVGVNFLGLVLFTQLLLPEVVKRQQDSGIHEVRVVNISSVAHLWAKIPSGESPLSLLGATMQPSAAVSYNTYGLSKLLLIMYTRALAAQLERTMGRAGKVTVVCVHPGAVLTEIFRELGVVASLMPIFLRTIFKSPEEGAETSLFASLGDTICNGAFYADLARMDDAVSPLCSDVKSCEAVYRLALQRWGLKGIFDT